MDEIEVKAKALFDSLPHNNPDPRTGILQIPDWDRQPETIKQVFRRKVQEVK